jgi:hypothetical protein
VPVPGTAGEVHQTPHEGEEALAGHRVHVIGLGFVENQVGDDAIVVPGVGEHLLQRVFALLDKFRTAVVLIGINLDAHDQLQPGILDKLQLWFGKLAPGPDGVVASFLDDLQIECQQIQIVRANTLIGMLPRARANFIADGLDEEPLAIQVIPVVLELNLGVRLSRTPDGCDQAQNAHQHGFFLMFV